MKIRYLSLFLLVFGLVLSACSSAATQAPANEVAEIEEPQAAEVVDPVQKEEIPTVEESATDAEEQAGEEEGEADEERVETLAEGESAFVLDPELTEARFTIGEILANSPNTVIGVTNQVRGGGILNSADPQLSRLSEFVIDASSFVTDSSLRNRAIREFILQSGQYPAIRFQPTEIIGIPSELNIGASVPFEVHGQLSIRDITQELTFSGEATMTAEDRVEGFAATMVNRSDFDLRIPNVPRVAGVDESFMLEIDFVAVPG